ncbi:phospholipase a2 [Mucor ambiguus]|uniref:Phospholipase a2 n=1 Tax=Mucor ambiguus TaxID=91626 RepID=A0A0C9MZN0_9FUNG|nr:phospholipase a2 [Mucor ambiguus]
MYNASPEGHLQSKIATPCYKISILVLSVSLASVLATNVANIASCPALKPRATPAKDVTDLRIDDFKIVGALGDSIMAGFAMMGIDYEGAGILNLSLVSEYRGNSYAIGGDTGAVTLSNFIKKYQPNVVGASILSHIVSFCNGDTCGFPETLYRPLRDNLNAGQSGAVAMNLDYELDYLIPRMKSYILSTSYKNDWKFITIQIGSNDQCASCNSSITDHVTATAYGQYVEAAIKRIKAEIPKTVVNLLGTFKVSGVFPLSAGQAYCVPNGILGNKNECSCSSSAENLAKMDALSDAYNQQLQTIADKYKGQPNGTFAVMYSPAPIDISTFPIDALSNVDCFHPSLKGHQWIAKSFWNQLFLKSSAKPSTMKFDANLGDADRLPTA